MLAADKLQLQSTLKQQATALKEKEFNLHHNNFSELTCTRWLLLIYYRNAEIALAIVCSPSGVCLLVILCATCAHLLHTVTVGTQAAVLAGLDVTMFIEFQPPPNSEWVSFFKPERWYAVFKVDFLTNSHLSREYKIQTRVSSSPCRRRNKHRLHTQQQQPNKQTIYN